MKRKYKTKKKIKVNPLIIIKMDKIGYQRNKKQNKIIKNKDK